MSDESDNCEERSDLPLEGGSAEGLADAARLHSLAGTTGHQPPGLEGSPGNWSSLSGDVRDILIERRSSGDEPSLPGFSALILKFISMNRKAQREVVFGLVRGLFLKRKFDVWDFPIIGREVVITKRRGARLEAGKFARFMDGCQVVIGTDASKTPTFRIGTKSSLGPGTKINVGDDFTIGYNTHLSWSVDASSDNFHVIRYADGTRSLRSAPVTVGNNCVVFRHVNINPGVSIGDNCAVGSAANVVNDIPSNVIAAGNPARPLRDIHGIDLSS